MNAGLHKAGCDGTNVGVQRRLKAVRWNDLLARIRPKRSVVMAEPAVVAADHQVPLACRAYRGLEP